jgi:hypothetical protein
LFGTLKRLSVLLPNIIKKNREKQVEFSI